MSTRAFGHLRQRLPGLRDLLDTVGAQRLPRVRQHVGEAIVRTVAGQMLSRSASESIYRRLVQERSELGLFGTWELPPDALQRCGLSSRKVKAIGGFAGELRARPREILNWKRLDYESLRDQVCNMWGMSDWTAAMLAIFHFRHPDVHPVADGSIQRAQRLHEQVGGVGLDWERARPYRSYLALSLWAALDSGYWRAFTTGDALRVARPPGIEPGT